MKKFVAMVFVFAIFILPSSFCAAKNSGPVYDSNWDNFFSHLKNNCQKAGLKFVRVNSVSFGKDIILGNQGAVTVHASSFDNFQSIGFVSISSYFNDDSQNSDVQSAEYSAALVATLRTLGVDDLEMQLFFKEFTKDMSKAVSSNKKKFKKQYSTNWRKTLYIKVEIEDIGFSTGFTTTITTYKQ